MTIVPFLPRPFGRLTRSIAVRLTLWFTLSSLLLLGSAIITVYWILQAHLSGEDKDHLETKGRLVAALLIDALPPDQVIKKVQAETRFSAAFPVFVRVLLDDGQTVAESAGMRDELPLTIFSHQTGVSLIRGITGKSYWAVSSVVRENGLPEPYTIQIATEAEDEQAFLMPFRQEIWLGFAVAFTLCGMTGYWIARSGVQPVSSLVQLSRQIQSSSLAMRIDTTQLPTELLPLGETLNEMLSRLQQAFSRISNFSDDIAHELRTPLSVIRGQMEVALSSKRSPEEYREVIESSLEEIVALSSLVNRMLFLSHIDHQNSMTNLERLDIGEELALIRDFYEPLATEESVVLEFAAPGTGIFGMVDRILFQRAVGNLVTNAIRHTPAGGRVVLETVQRGGELTISVTDNGRGIPKEHLPHLFDRFHRVESGHGSMGEHLGLGLAIVKRIVDLHHGSIDLVSTLGQGTCVKLRLPAAPVS